MCKAVVYAYPLIFVCCVIVSERCIVTLSTTRWKLCEGSVLRDQIFLCDKCSLLIGRRILTAYDSALACLCHSPGACLCSCSTGQVRCKRYLFCRILVVSRQQNGSFSFSSQIVLRPAMASDARSYGGETRGKFPSRIPHIIPFDQPICRRSYLCFIRSICCSLMSSRCPLDDTIRGILSMPIDIGMRQSMITNVVRWTQNEKLQACHFELALGVTLRFVDRI